MANRSLKEDRSQRAVKGIDTIDRLLFNAMYRVVFLESVWLTFAMSRGAFDVAGADGSIALLDRSRFLLKHLEIIGDDHRSLKSRPDDSHPFSVCISLVIQN